MTEQNTLKEQRGPKMLAGHALVIEVAKTNYVAVLLDLQAACAHPAILRHENERHVSYRVCEDCGAWCRARWDSLVHVEAGDPALLGKRAYNVSWAEYYRALPVVAPPEGGNRLAV